MTPSHRANAISAFSLGALIVLGGVGCARVPQTPGDAAPTVIAAPGTAGAAVDPAPYRPNFVEADAVSFAAAADGYVHGYSNTYVYETLERYVPGPFTSADYYDTGGYPVYYPYPYTIVRPLDDDYWRRHYGGRFGGFSRSRSGQSSGGSNAIGAADGDPGSIARGVRARAKPARGTTDISGHQKRSADTAAGRARARSPMGIPTGMDRSGPGDRVASTGARAEARYRQRATGSTGGVRSRGASSGSHRQMVR